MPKKLTLVVAVSVFVGICAGSLFLISIRAGIFDGVGDFFRGRLEKSIPSTQSLSAGKKEVELYKSTVDYENAVILAVENANPAVVSIIVSKDLPIIERCPVNPFGNLPPRIRDFFGDDFGFQYYELCQQGTEKREIGGGSGFIVSSEGLIVTNKHVVLDEEAEYTVLTNDGKKYDVDVLARDPVQDIAILKINSFVGKLTAVKLGDSDSLRLGQTVIAIGNALGEFRNTVSVGAVSGLARSITAFGAGGFVEDIDNVIQTDAAINQGNSGGPLLNLNGEVIGMNTAVISGAQNIGFAIPINQVRRDIESVEETGKIQAPFLGVRYFTITPEFAEKQNLFVEYGVLLRGTEGGPAVMPESAAASAGLQAEDIILEFDGEKITPENSFGSLIRGKNIGDSIALRVLRGEEELVLQAVLEERPEM